MKLSVITVQRVIGFIVLAPTAFLFTVVCLMDIFSWITRSTVEDIKIMIGIVVLTALTDFLFLSLTLPRFYNSMRVVKGIMSYHDLKKCIAKDG